MPNFKKDLEFYLSVAPPDWKIMYLGGSFGRSPTHYNQHFSKQNMTWGAFAYIVHSSIYDELINEWRKHTKISDAVLIDFQNKYLCVKPLKTLVKHPEGYSEIKEKQVNYQHIV